MAAPYPEGLILPALTPLHMIHSFIVCLFSQESESLRTGALSVLLLALSWCPEQWLILPQLSDESTTFVT